MARVKGTSKMKKKRWVQIYAPTYLNSTFIGDSYVMEPETLVNRCVSCNVMHLTNNMRKQSMSIQFTIDKVTGEKASTKFYKYRIVPSAVRRLIRRGRDRVDYTCEITTKDGSVLQINALLLTTGNTFKSVLSDLRAATHDILEDIGSKQTVGELVKNVVDSRVQEQLKKALGKIYPVRIVEIRTMKLVSGDAPSGEVEVTQSEEEPVEAEDDSQEPVENSQSEDSDEDLAEESNDESEVEQDDEEEKKSE